MELHLPKLLARAQATHEVTSTKDAHVFYVMGHPYGYLGPKASLRSMLADDRRYPEVSWFVHEGNNKVADHLESESGSVILLGDDDKGRTMITERILGRDIYHEFSCLMFTEAGPRYACDDEKKVAIVGTVNSLHGQVQALLAAMRSMGMIVRFDEGDEE